jgi:hypothetical protein
MQCVQHNTLLPLILVYNKSPNCWCCAADTAVQGIFGTATLQGIGWLPMLGSALFLFSYTEMTKRITRRNPDCWWARHIAW